MQNPMQNPIIPIFQSFSISWQFYAFKKLDSRPKWNRLQSTVGLLLSSFNSSSTGVDTSNRKVCACHALIKATYLLTYLLLRVSLTSRQTRPCSNYHNDDRSNYMNEERTERQHRDVISLYRTYSKQRHESYRAS